jgi:hypothetical protein
MSSSEMRIGIVGTAGTGKSSLARGLAESLGLQLNLSKTITQKILDRDGYDYGSGIQVEKFLATEVRQRQILEDTIQSNQLSNNFVSDRTVIDLAAYAIAELHSVNPDVLNEIYNICFANVGRYTHIAFCEWNSINLIDNGRRTLNPYYQFVIHSIEKELCHEWGCKPIFLGVMDDDKRVKFVLDELKRR